MANLIEIIKFLEKEGLVLYQPRNDWNPLAEITGISQHWNAKKGDIAWTSDKNLKSFSGSLLLIPEDGLSITNSVLCKHPRLTFIKVLQKFFHKPDEHDIEGNTIIENTLLGYHVTIGFNCVIGTEGFGHGKDENGIWQRFPHFGKVIIGNNVEIGSSVNIQRGTIGDTIIGNNVRVWHQTNIGHNVSIGHKAVILNNAILCGGVTVGEGSWISPGAIIKNQIKIGAGSLIGLGAVVLKDVPDKTIVAGNPAQIIGKVNENTYNMRSY